MKKQDVKVDIIIPIYNAYEYTKKCIETVIQNTDLQQNTLILINDKSPDDKILPMLKEFEAANLERNICIINNEENVGFVKTVNIGMRCSEHDVVLLNSDTEVTKDWLSKMQYTAYIRENVATVTPLSNNATLASIPNFLEENDLPSYLSLEEYAEKIEHCSLNVFPEIPTAHGFCMYIKREAINIVGLFDEVTFEKGYGEENDFSYRCINCGFTHLLCDNTFIYHKGTQSFSKEKQEFVDKHLKLLQERYPRNFEMTSRFCQQNPIELIQDNVKYSVNNQDRKNILIVVHEFRKRDSKLLGGTVLHIYDLIDALRSKMNFHVLYPENGFYKLASFFENSTTKLDLGKINSYEQAQLYHYEYQNIIKQIFEIIPIDFVHVHHVLNHYFDIFSMLQERNIPYMVSLHDFYFICPSIVLVEDKMCCVNRANLDCKNCKKYGKWIEKRRKIAHQALRGAKAIVAPSNSTKEIFKQYYKDLNITVIEHGMEKIQEIYEIKNFKENKNIAFIGGVNQVKGLNILKELTKKVNQKDNEYRLHLFGITSDTEFNETDGNFIFHGMYDRENIIQLLKENNIGLVCLFSIWPETYSYTLTEAIIAGIPVLVLDYGALSERTKKDNLGWVLDKNVTTEQIVEKINQIFSEPEEYQKKIESIQSYLTHLKTVEEMAKEYENLYDSYMLKQSNLQKNINREVLENLLKIKMQLLAMKENCQWKIGEYQYELNRVNGEYQNRIGEYHETVIAYKAEIERLNHEIENYKKIEEQYNQLISSRKLKVLKKIKFIKY